MPAPAAPARPGQRGIDGSVGNLVKLARDPAQDPIPPKTVAPAKRPRGARATHLPRKLVEVLIPTKNEAKGLAATLRAIPLEAVQAMGHDAITVVADGNSSDGTPEIAAQEGATVLRLAGKGKGRDFRLAMAHCTADYLIMLDGDGTYPAEDIPAFVKALEDGADVVMGSRLLKKGSIEEGALSTTNLIGNHLLSGMASVLYGKRTTDVCTGMWGFTRDALAKMELNSNKFEIEAELFLQAVRAKLKVVEVPIQYRVRFGESKLGGWKTGLRIGGKLVRQWALRS